MRNEYFSKLSLFATIMITLVALAYREITVFYMLYLFWWQGLAEVLGNIIIEMKKKNSFYDSVSKTMPSIYIMMFYLFFIVILFGVVFSFSNFEMFTLNFEVFLFRNIPFNINILLSFTFTFLKFFNNNSEIQDPNFGIFSTKMLILHVSIVLGGMLHFGILKLYPNSFDDSIIPYLLSAIPFLILRSFFEWKSLSGKEEPHNIDLS